MEDGAGGKGNAADGEQRDIWRVGVRIPPFYPEDPELWFNQIEAQFVLSNITSDTTKFYYAVTQLEPTYVSHVKDVLRAPPATGKFEKLKNELVKRLSASKEKKLQQLFLNEDIGDRKPSHFLRHLRNLAGPTVSDDVLMTLWTGRLPHNLQTVVASQPKLSLDDLAELADRVHEIAPAMPHQQVAMASTSLQPASISNIDSLQQEICALTREVAKLTSYVHRQSRAHSRSRSQENHNRKRSHSRNRQPPPDHPHCWYHYNFGARAKKCTEPCEFRAGNDGGSRK
ncbi:uncharacterized protein LOC111354195 [Spodoptera litura]|uniref:Uncharacterized protein LOC111349265 n=1 Tax=Spodoptera litura TaxID=69820 RepID=A0A9J7IRJ3_SPOLT|nr:uncharacterized protein LOC111349265 [Spodoptera litura]XP_022823304.1 uncharacterized protein LOC111354195 [Spodoptera litura]